MPVARSSVPTPDADTSTRDRILDVVIELLDSHGYDGFGLRDVAKQARVSLATVYKLFPTRDELVVAALVRWHRERGLAEAAPLSAEMSVRDSLLYLLRQSFGPWEEHPNIFKAYARMMAMPIGAELHRQIGEALVPIKLTEEVRKAKTILVDVAYAAAMRYAAGLIDVTELREYLEEVVDWLASDDEAVGAGRGTAARRLA